MPTNAHNRFYSNHNDYPKPERFTRREWLAMSNERRAEIADAEATKKSLEQEEFEQKMKYEPLSTPELTWLRDQLLQLQTQVWLNQTKK